ncbi:HD domain-containing phosphohydrolase [Vibrio agarivorans]|uniref:HD domain-containing phosphohydrolase n=1 Tax=Vibrio agarivorans TaxID=153622 RepID=UPI0025B37D93|nr:HD domain-containing phosphohydrolase [Vibrio agarivorans]MDN3660948.1 HD domain-containing phosphohydrolase [Vibrio agarivorans]
MEEKSKKRVLPLHIHISTLFVLTVLIICSTLIYLTHSSLNRVLMSANTQLFAQIASETKNTLNRHYAPAFASVSSFANSYIHLADTQQEEKVVLSQAAFLLKEYAHITSFSVSYPDGRVSMLVTLNDPAIRHMFKEVEHGSYVFLAGDVKSGELRIDILDRLLNVISTANTELGDYQGLAEVWRSHSLVGETHISQPYLYPRLNKIGIAFYSKGQDEIVVAAHILLSSLSESLSETSTQASGIRVLFSPDKQLYAYNNLSDLDESELKNDQKIWLRDLNNPVIDHAVAQRDRDGTLNEFEYDGEQWFGQVEVIGDYHGTQLYLLMADKSQEMLKDAYDIRSTTIFASIIILLISVPIIYQLSQRLAKPIVLETQRARSIERFDFTTSYQGNSSIKEIFELKSSLKGMQRTINRYINLTNKIAHEPNLDELLKLVALDTVEAVEADGVVIMLLDDEQAHLEPRYVWFNQSNPSDLESVRQIKVPIKGTSPVIEKLLAGERYQMALIKDLHYGRNLVGMDADKDGFVFLPLRDRNRDVIGVFGLLYRNIDRDYIVERYIEYINSLLDYVAVSIDARTMLKAQKDLLEAVIRVIANALDTKSPYTGNHCQRVPVLTEWLSYAAHESQTAPFAHFSLSETDKEALHIAAWLHDCGKVTTPEHVVDKATKLETIYNRIHEIRTRFEVVKRDKHLQCYRACYGDLDQGQQQQLKQEWKQLDEDFAFVASLNEGSESLSESAQQRLLEIAQQTWKRTIDNSLGLSWEERERLSETQASVDSENQKAQEIEVTEGLLEDKPEQRIDWTQPRPTDERFNLPTPELQNNLGELYNLLVQRGTLNDEERFVINDHIVQTILMLEALPFPKGMNQIPQIAGGHHEKLDGKGYPQGLTKQQMPLTARVMAIADIFEALTSADRPYKKAKTLSEALSIMHKMANDSHIDADLFHLFLSSGLYLKYAEQFLNPEQIDEVDISLYLS